MKKILYLVSLILLTTIFENPLNAAMTRWPVATNISYEKHGDGDFRFRVNNIKLINVYIPDAVLDQHIIHNDMCKYSCDFGVFKIDKKGNIKMAVADGGATGIYEVITWRDFIKKMAKVNSLALASRFEQSSDEEMAEGCFGVFLGTANDMANMTLPYGQSYSNVCINPPPAPDSCSFLNADNAIDIKFGDVEVGNIARTSKTINIETKCTKAMSFNLKNMAGSGDDVYLSNGMKADVKFDGSALSDIRNVSAGTTTHTLKVTLAGKPVSITAGGPFTGNVVLMINYQ